MKKPDFRKVGEQLRNDLSLLQAWQQQHIERTAGKRAFVIEFAGMPKAGKSSTIEGVRHFFTHGPKELSNINSPVNKIGYRVHTPAEGVSLRTPNYLKNNPIDFNTWAGAYAIQELIEAAHDDHHYHVILDRGPWDASCWLEYWKTQGGTADVDYINKIENFFQLDHWLTRADLHVVLVVDTKEAAKRERDERIIDHAGVSSKDKLMKQMHNIYTTRFKSLQGIKRSQCEHVGENAAILLNTTQMDPAQVVINVIESTFRVLESKIQRHIKEFRFTKEWLQAKLKGYEVRATPAVRKELKKFYPTFLNDANLLTPDQRQALARSIEEVAFPEVIDSYFRITINEINIISRLKELIEKAKGDA